MRDLYTGNYGTFRHIDDNDGDADGGRLGKVSGQIIRCDTNDRETHKNIKLQNPLVFH